LSKVVVSFDLLKRRTFNHGEIYVSLSSVTSLQGLFLNGNFSDTVIKVNEKAKLAYQYLRENQAFQQPTPDEYVLLSTVICNVMSLKHVSDIKVDSHFHISKIVNCNEKLVPRNASRKGASVCYM